LRYSGALRMAGVIQPDMLLKNVPKDIAKNAPAKFFH
jgi:hypothetical protein